MARQLKSDSIYAFRYKDPATKKRLEVWDTAPLIIPLDITSKSLLAVNLHWIPSKYRQDFVDYLMQYFKQGKVGGKRMKRTRLYYNFVKSGKIRWAMVAIRRYHLSRITDIKEVPRDQWPKVLNIRSYRAKFKYTDWKKNVTRAFRKPVR